MAREVTLVELAFVTAAVEPLEDALSLHHAVLPLADVLVLAHKVFVCAFFVIAFFVLLARLIDPFPDRPYILSFIPAHDAFVIIGDSVHIAAVVETGRPAKPFVLAFTMDLVFMPLA